ncbi:hypothetical protein LCGC14_2004390 [marine sediment metagenome]|uniref:Uncharacterized protein n=1 Tax=marine sediment metagenome TaxID=412755 RepID=A0A0F9FPY3_9ZZZZ
MIAVLSLFALLLIQAIMDGMRQPVRAMVPAGSIDRRAQVSQNENDHKGPGPLVAVAGGLGAEGDASGANPDAPSMDELFASGDWVAGGTDGRISDFERGEDALVVSYDPASMTDPEVTVRTAENGTDAEVLLDGKMLVLVEGAAGTLRAEDVWLVEDGAPDAE